MARSVRPNYGRQLVRWNLRGHSRRLAAAGYFPLDALPHKDQRGRYKGVATVVDLQPHDDNSNSSRHLSRSCNIVLSRLRVSHHLVEAAVLLFRLLEPGDLG